VSGKATRAAVIARVDIVYRLLLLGLDRARILEHVERKYSHWGVKTRTIDGYAARAKVLMVEAGYHDRPLESGRSLARKHDLYSRFYADKDWRGAQGVQKDIDNQLGLNAPLRVDIATVRQQLVDLLLEDVLGEADEIARGAAQ
jgi:hypothetical protein